MSNSVEDTTTGGGKAREILHELRAQIVAGKHLPGHRMPSYVAMEQEFGVGRAILQQAVESLKRDGFVRSVNRQGLYVVRNPPHLHQYGLLFSSLPGEAGWTQLVGALTREARRVEADDPFARFSFYHGLQDPDTRHHVAEQLRKDILSHRLAGLILTPKTFDVLGEPALDGLDTSVAELWSLGTDGHPATRINTDAPALIRRALTHLKNAGRKRIAVLHMAETTSCLDHADAFAQAGLELHAPWIQYVGRSHPRFAENLVALLLDYRRDVRPDGFLIADDTLVGPTLDGLRTAGLRLGQDCDVVAHANWPCAPRSDTALTRIGFDIRDILRRAIDTIGLRARGEQAPELEVVPALFEWEVDGPCAVIEEQPKE